MSLLSCHNVDVGIAGIKVAKNLDIELKAGEFWGLLGPNGVGKTTLLKCLAGLIAPAGGAILVDGQDIAHMSRRKVAKKLGMLQQHTVYLFDSSALEIALTGRHPHLRSWDRESAADVRLAESALEAVDLRGFAERGVTSLSGGEARRLAFAALLVQDPQILLLDEPTNHLDLRHQLRIMAATSNLASLERRAVIAALHDINLAVRYCSHVLMLFGDGLWHAGPTTEVLNAEALERLFGCEVETAQTVSGPKYYPSDAAAS